MTTITLLELIHRLDPEYLQRPVVEYAFKGGNSPRRFEARGARGAYDGTVYPDETEDYLLADGSRPMDDGYEPAAATDIATKGYVDALIATLEA